MPESKSLNILMISIDKTLVGGKKLGDAIERHRRYGEFVNRLDIIVYSNKKDRLSEFTISDNVVGYPTSSSSKLSFFFDALKIAKKIQIKQKCDLVVCQDPFLTGLVGLWIKKKYQVKLLMHFHHSKYWRYPVSFNDYFVHYFTLLISKFTVPRADAIRVMSNGQKEKLLKSGIDGRKIGIISTPIDLKRFETYENQKPEHKRQIDSLKSMIEDKKMILMVGRKDKVKDFPTLFKAINLVYEKYQNIGLWLVGNYAPGELKSLPLINEMKAGSIFISGNINSVDLPAYYKISYMAVLSSTSESFGKVLVEANACGKPVVATATTGAKEIVKDGYNGYLVPIDDAGALAGKILELLNNPEKARQMGENGRRLVRERFGDNTTKIIQFWQDIVANKI